MTTSAQKLRALYWLALLQLVAGPLVLVQVAIFCKMTARELPQQSVTEAMSRAWDSREFQTALAVSDGTGAVDESKPSSPSKREPNPKAKKDGAKFFVIEWQRVPVLLAVPMNAMERTMCAKSWTPAWSQAPPGPPPRVA